MEFESTTMKQYIQSAQIVLPGSPFDETLEFFTNRLSFRVDSISPADDPAVVVISGHGVNIRLERNAGELTQSAGTIRLLLAHKAELFANEITELFAPNGTKIQIVEATPNLVIPPVQSSFVVSKMSTDAQWVKGRAGMNYRDLIPDRQGGCFIASHIQIPNGGPVPDHVHYHDIRFQMIYVYKGWVRLVYENQGSPFVLQAGDCVLQPPLIRHRVLESSVGLEVIEVACPAVHNTYIDHNIELPTADERSDRDYGGQRFVKYIATEDKTNWQPWRLSGFEFRDTGIGAATQNLAGVRIVRSNGDVKPQRCQHNSEFVFVFVLTGELSLHVDDRNVEKLTAGDTFVMPEKLSYAFSEWSKNVRLLEVSLPETVIAIYK